MSILNPFLRACSTILLLSRFIIWMHLSFSLLPYLESNRLRTLLSVCVRSATFPLNTL